MERMKERLCFTKLGTVDPHARAGLLETASWDSRMSWQAGGVGLQCVANSEQCKKQQGRAVAAQLLGGQG